MARIPMVTRTIESTEVNVLCVDVVAGEPFNKDVTVAGTYKDEKSLMKAVEKIVNTDEIKAVHIVHTETKETLYGMTVDKFIERADVLPPRGTIDTTIEE